MKWIKIKRALGFQTSTPFTIINYRPGGWKVGDIACMSGFHYQARVIKVTANEITLRFIQPTYWSDFKAWLSGCFTSYRLWLLKYRIQQNWNAIKKHIAKSRPK
jgi:hypothetical protein